MQDKDVTITIRFRGRLPSALDANEVAANLAKALADEINYSDGVVTDFRTKDQWVVSVKDERDSTVRDHDGGECPVPEHTTVDMGVMGPEGSTEIMWFEDRRAGNWEWKWDGAKPVFGSVIHYRVKS